MEPFDQFWSAYPKRRAKKDAQKAWRQVDGARHLDAILAALEWQTRQREWTKDDGAYVPLPASYLRGERWTDEPPVSARRQQAVDEGAEYTKWLQAQRDARSARSV